VAHALFLVNYDTNRRRRNILNFKFDMNELTELRDRVAELEKQLAAIKRDNLMDNLSLGEVEKMKGYIFERTTSNVSGSINGGVVVNIYGKRRVFATYPDFPTTT